MNRQERNRIRFSLILIIIAQEAKIGQASQATMHNVAELLGMLNMAVTSTDADKADQMLLSMEQELISIFEVDKRIP